MKIIQNYLKTIKKGDIVGRISYNKDILFVVERILNTQKNSIAILKGLIVRIEADAPISDLVVIEKSIVSTKEKELDKVLNARVSQNSKRNMQKTTGKILHLDGDRRYSEKSARYYQKIGLNAIVKNISENRQPSMVKILLEKYNPDILIITGHDAMLKNGANYNDLYNYRNSRYFINTVREARKWKSNKDELVIFAGACQSYFEALIAEGANFASSPGRILIDFIDPLVIAEKVAITDENMYVTIWDILKELKDGNDGVGGSSARGKRKVITL